MLAIGCDVVVTASDARRILEALPGLDLRRIDIMARYIQQGGAVMIFPAGKIEPDP